MCGLVGMAGSLTRDHRNMMKDLLFFDTLRGRDSTGVGIVRRDREVMLKKATLPGFEFIESPNFDDWLKVGDQLWLGHNRFKTVGAANRANAHPFIVEDEEEFIGAIGAHNGTLRNKYEIERKLNGEKYGTDSEALMNLMAEIGVKEAIAEAEGAWSVTYWDAGTNSLKFIRNKERPLIYAFSKDRKTLFWASEAWMILAAARRNGVDLEVAEGKDVSCYHTIEDTLYTIEIPQKLNDEFGEFDREGGVRGKPERTFQNNNYGGYGSHRRFWEDLADEAGPAALGGPVKETETKDAEKAKTSITVIGEQAPLVHAGGNTIPRAELEALKKAGCTWCDKEVKENVPTFLGPKEIVCRDCMVGGLDRREYIARRDAPLTDEPVAEKVKPTLTVPKTNVIEMPSKKIAAEKQAEARTRLQQIVDNVKKKGSK